MTAAATGPTSPTHRHLRPDGAAGPISGADYAHLVELTRSAVARTGGTITAERTGTLSIEHGDERRSEMHLDALVRAAAREPRASWPALVTRYVGSVIGVALLSREDRKASIDHASIRLSFAPAGCIPTGLARPFAGPLEACVVVDRPDSVAYLGADVLREATGLDDDALFELGLANLRSALAVVREPVDGTPFPVDYLRVDDAEANYTSSAALLLDQILEADAAALVALPAAEAAILSPLQDLADLPARLPHIAGMALRAAAVCDHPLPTALYLWRGGRWDAIAFVAAMAADSRTAG